MKLLSLFFFALSLAGIAYCRAPFEENELVKSFIQVHHDGSASDATPTPIVMWHGMGDSCCNPLSLGSVIKFIQKQIPNVYILSIRIGNNIIEDTLNGYLMNVNDQVKLVRNNRIIT